MLKVPLVALALLDLLETVAALVTVALLDLRDSQDLRVQKDRPDQPEPLDSLAFEVPLVRRARLATEVLQDKWETLDQPDYEDHRDLGVSEEELEEPDSLET